MGCNRFHLGIARRSGARRSRVSRAPRRDRRAAGVRVRAPELRAGRERGPGRLERHRHDASNRPRRPRSRPSTRPARRRARHACRPGSIRASAAGADRRLAERALRRRDCEGPGEKAWHRSSSGRSGSASTASPSCCRRTPGRPTTSATSTETASATAGTRSSGVASVDLGRPVPRRGRAAAVPGLRPRFPALARAAPDATSDFLADDDLERVADGRPAGRGSTT